MAQTAAERKQLERQRERYSVRPGGRHFRSFYISAEALDTLVAAKFLSDADRENDIAIENAVNVCLGLQEPRILEDGCVEIFASDDPATDWLEKDIQDERRRVGHRDSKRGGV
jgi:hypothetical protein